MRCGRSWPHLIVTILHRKPYLMVTIFDMLLLAYTWWWRLWWCWQWRWWWWWSFIVVIIHLNSFCVWLVGLGRKQDLSRVCLLYLRQFGPHPGKMVRTRRSLAPWLRGNGASGGSHSALGDSFHDWQGALVARFSCAGTWAPGFKDTANAQKVKIVCRCTLLRKLQAHRAERKQRNCIWWWNLVVIIAETSATQDCFTSLQLGSWELRGHHGHCWH